MCWLDRPVKAAVLAGQQGQDAFAFREHMFSLLQHAVLR